MDYYKKEIVPLLQDYKVGCLQQCTVSECILSLQFLLKIQQSQIALEVFVWLAFQQSVCSIWYKLNSIGPEK